MEKARIRLSEKYPDSRVFLRDAALGTMDERLSLKHSAFAKSLTLYRCDRPGLTAFSTSKIAATDAVYLGNLLEGVERYSSRHRTSVYECAVTGVTLLHDEDKMVSAVEKGYRMFVRNLMLNPSASSSALKRLGKVWLDENDDVTDELNSRKGFIKFMNRILRSRVLDSTYVLRGLYTEYLIALGFDGKMHEGTIFNEEIEVAIFDPKKVMIIKETRLPKATSLRR